MDPRFGLVGPGRLLERAPPTSTDSLVRLRPGDWWLGSLVSYKGELIEEGTITGWFPAAHVTVVKVEDNLNMSDEEAIVMLQSSTRGYLCRRRQRKTWDACTKIQKMARGMIQRTRFVRAKYVLRGVAEAIIAKRLMNLTKAQCTAALFNRMRVGAATQLRRRIMAHNNGFAYGESNSSAVSWRIDELENDITSDEGILKREINKTFASCTDEFGGLRKDLTPAEIREVERKKLLIPVTVPEGDMMGRGGSRGGAGEILPPLGSTPGGEGAAEEEEEVGVGVSMGEESNGLETEQSNWLDSVGKFYGVSDVQWPSAACSVSGLFVRSCRTFFEHFYA